MLPATPSGPFVAAFTVLSVLMAAGFVWAVVHSQRAQHGERAARRWGLAAAVGAVVWMGLTGGLAMSGALAFGPMPPPMMVLFVVMILGTVGVALSPVGAALAKLPLWLLVGFQAFRIPVELLLHRSYEEGLMPIEMSYLGWNFDVVTGVAALILGAALAFKTVPGWVVWGWNVLGFALLANIVTIALLATPAFDVLQTDPPNVWVTHAPFIWLPTVLVTSALLGHLLVWRAKVSEV